MEIWLTKHGVPVIQPLKSSLLKSSLPTARRVILDPVTRTWGHNLGFVPPTYYGRHFLIHYVATLPDGTVVRGAGTQFFEGPPQKATG